MPFDLKMPGMPGAAPTGSAGSADTGGGSSSSGGGGGSMMDQLGSILGGNKGGGGGGSGSSVGGGIGVNAGVGEKGPVITIPGLGSTRAGSNGGDDGGGSGGRDGNLAGGAGSGIAEISSDQAATASRGVVIEELATAGGGEVDEESGVATPEYTVVTDAAANEVVVTVQLPNVGSVGEIELDVTQKSFRLNVPEQYELDFTLPQPVNHDASKAKFKKKSHKLILRIPLL